MSSENHWKAEISKHLETIIRARTAVHTWPQGTKETYNVPTSRQEKLDAIDKLLESQTPEGLRPIGRIKWSEEEIKILKTGKGLKLFQISIFLYHFLHFQECRSMEWI